MISLERRRRRKRRQAICYEVDRHVGGVIRNSREQLGLSQTKVAEALGVSFQQIQKYEHGKNSVAAARMPTLCRLLNLSPNDLFEDIA